MHIGLGTVKVNEIVTEMGYQVQPGDEVKFMVSVSMQQAHLCFIEQTKGF